jgi:integrase
MATTNFYLDTRAVRPGFPAPLKITIHKSNSTAYIPTGVSLLPSQWDKRSLHIVNHPQRQRLNTLVSRLKSDVDFAMLSLIQSGEAASLSASAVKARILAALRPSEDAPDDNLFVARFRRFANSKRDTTRKMYLHTLSRIRRFAPDEIDTLRFEDITKDWLTAFDNYLARTAPSANARNIHLRNIRAVFNDALDDEVTSAYPFRRFKIRPVATPKRSLSVEQLRLLFNTPVEPYVQKYVDAFKLIFCLCGINCVDLCNLSSVVDGRIEYHRAKTHRFYSIKVEPEAAELIDRLRGNGSHLLYMLDRFQSHSDYLKRLNIALKHVGPMQRVGRGGRKVYAPLFPGLSSYWARHTWATIAADLDIPDATISLALGHAAANSTTEIYIRRNLRKVDEANRRVLDWVFYGKK